MGQIKYDHIMWLSMYLAGRIFNYRAKHELNYKSSF